jgi:hypothetical protein
MKTKATHYFIIGSFVTLYLLVSIISTIHVVDFFKLSNPTWLAVSLAIGFEVGAAASLASLIVLDKMNKSIVWGLFILLTAMQAMGNTFYAYSHLENFTAWVELFGLQEEELIYQKRMLSIISGAVLPIVALGFIKSLVDYIKPAADLPEPVETVQPTSTDLAPIEPWVEEVSSEKPKPIKKAKPAKETPIEVDLTVPTPIQASIEQDELTAKQKTIALYDMPDRSTRRLSPDEIIARGFKA